MANEVIEWFKSRRDKTPMTGARKMFNAAISALEQAERERWIPVTERLPETEDKVLCCTITKKGIKNIVIGYHVLGKDYWACGMNSNVIAWRPLPKPYQE